MAAYEFTVTAVGIGDCEEEAWDDVWEYLVEKIQKAHYDGVMLLDGEVKQ
jgi:hypothetical protein